MTTIALSTADPTAIAADAVVIGIAAHRDAVRVLAEADRVDGAVGGSLAVMLKALGATGKRDEVTKVATTTTKATVVVAIPILIAAATWEAYVWPRILAAASPGL